MASVNRVILVGNLGKDPDVRYTPSGEAVVNFSLATTDKWKDKAGEQQERTEWHRIVLFGRQAEIAAEYLKKGAQVYVEGSLQTRKYEKNGEDRYVTEIKGQSFQMLGKRERGEASAQDYQERKSRPAPPTSSGGSGFDDMTDDIPF